MEYKQVIVVRDNLNLSRGKLAVQVAHAAVIGCDRADRQIVEKWKQSGQKKIVLKADLQKMMELKEKAKKAGIATGTVVDAGLTEIPPGTITSIVIGPDEEKKIDKITGNIPLLSD
ncbi:MAG TPA: peptidyl-tRNA hydrolase [Archaeoglobaceae archaeon]|nr:peptidyl-tRNA hydrolase [Archaeoglobaceae archaeon]